MGIGKRLRYILKIKAIKHKDLADYLGISASRLSNYMNDKREPDFNTLVRIASYIREPLDTFADTGSGYPEPAPEWKSVCEKPEKYDKSGGLTLPLQELYAKRKSPSQKKVVLGESFFEGIPEPEKNGAVFVSQAKFPDYGIGEGDFIICAGCAAAKPQSGDKILKNGRYPSLYRYHESGGIRALLDSHEAKNIILKSPEEINSYYKIFFIMKKG